MAAKWLIPLEDGTEGKGDAGGPARSAVMVIPAGCDYAQLTALRERTGPVLAEPGVVFSDIDESRNQLRIGALEGVSTAQIEAVLRRLGVPLDAVSIETTEPIEPVATLRELQNPVAGGLQIWRFEPPSTAWICTLGFNVIVDGVTPRSSSTCPASTRSSA